MCLLGDVSVAVVPGTSLLDALRSRDVPLGRKSGCTERDDKG
jgi:hypothetical protein